MPLNIIYCRLTLKGKMCIYHKSKFLSFLGLNIFTPTYPCIETWTWHQHPLPVKVWLVTSHPVKNSLKMLKRNWWETTAEDFKPILNGEKILKSIWKRKKLIDEKKWKCLRLEKTWQKLNFTANIGEYLNPTLILKKYLCRSKDK